MAEHPRSRWRTPCAVLVLGTMLVAAFTGVLGGGKADHVAAQGAGVSGELVYDPIVRSGNWFETQVTIRATTTVEDLTIGIDAPLWQGMSIDTIVPDAESVEALDGRYAFHFGEVKAGESFRLKLNGQIQPGLLRRQSGAIRVLDDTREMMALPVRLWVLP